MLGLKINFQRLCFANKQQEVLFYFLNNSQDKRFILSKISAYLFLCDYKLWPSTRYRNILSDILLFLVALGDY